jgi:hypothetical protein
LPLLYGITSFPTSVEVIPQYNRRLTWGGGGIVRFCLTRIFENPLYISGAGSYVLLRIQGGREAAASQGPRPEHQAIFSIDFQGFYFITHQFSPFD